MREAEKAVKAAVAEEVTGREVDVVGEVEEAVEDNKGNKHEQIEKSKNFGHSAGLSSAYRRPCR